MVVDKYVSRCLDVGSTPTGSIIPLHSFAFLGKTLLNQRFLFFLWYSLVFFCEKGSYKRSHKKEANLLKNQYNSQSVLRCRPWLAWLCGCKRSWSFSNQNALDDVGLASKSYPRRNKGWHVYV